MNYYRQGPNRPYGSGTRIAVPGLTPVVKVIMITCAVVWVLQALFDRNGAISLVFGVTPLAILGGRLWQPVTYMFLHAPAFPMHLLLNMLILWMFGGELERHWGSRGFLRYYLVCGIGAGVLAAVLAVFTNTFTITIGASGAIYGLILAYGIVFADRVVLFMMIFPMKARTMSWILFGVAFLSAMTGSTPGVSHIAHLGGMLIGFLYLKRAWRVREFYRELRWKLLRRRFRVLPPDDDRWVN